MNFLESDTHSPESVPVETQVCILWFSIITLMDLPQPPTTEDNDGPDACETLLWRNLPTLSLDIEYLYPVPCEDKITPGQYRDTEAENSALDTSERNNQNSISMTHVAHTAT